MFYNKQPENQRKQYIKLLQVVGSLSKLFSESSIPYLYYRAAENIFCKAFEAHNLSRGDISFDAFKDGVGIGLKTFTHGNGKSYQKVAEFNKDIDKFRGKSVVDTVKVIASLRNERISVAMRAHDIKEIIYHLVTRKEGVFELYEEEMHLIDMQTLQIDTKKTTDKNIFFSDKHAEYKFYIAKSTLYKKFITDNPLDSFKVKILDDPFKFLLSDESKKYYMVHEGEEEKYEQIYLPLYSAKSGKVEPKSGLNQWNAGGRDRHEDEIYIPIPAWIHEKFEGFFPYDRRTGRKEPFTLILPNNRELSASICQSGGKGLMSNPNKELGHWLLRTVLQIPVGQVVTYDDLDKIGIDSVIVTKLDDYKFKINFAATGSYAEFEEEFKI